MVWVLGARLLGLALLLAGCSGAPPPTYGSTRPVATTGGRVVASRVVAIAGDPTEPGPAAVAAFWAFAAGSVVPLPVVGGLVGAGVGHLAGRWLRGDGEGIEYVVALADGRTVTLVQERDDAEAPLPAGTAVLVRAGARSSRVLDYARATRHGPGDDPRPALRADAFRRALRDEWFGLDLGDIRRLRSAERRDARP